MQWAGLVAPAGTPRPIIEKLHKEVVVILRTPHVMSAMAKLGTDVATSANPEEFAAFIKAETVKWAAVAKAAGIEPK